MISPALKQYLDIFADNRPAIDAGSAPALNALRQAACDTLCRLGRLPARHDEGFEKTSIEDMFAPDFGINVGRVDIPVDVAASFRCDVPNMSTLMAIVANDRFVPTSTLLKNLPEGVEVMSLADAARRFPQDIASTYGSVAHSALPGVALNTMLAQDGVYIRVKRGIRLDRPIQIVNIFSSPTPLMAFRRVLVDVGEGADVNILVCDHSQGRDVAYASSQVVEIIARADSRVGWFDIEESSPSTARYSQLFASQHRGSTLTVNSSTLINGTTRNEFNIAIDGENSSAGLYGMAIGSGSQHIDNSSTIIHRAPRATSNQLFKYVLDDKASGAFEGGIEVTPQAPFTEAYQSNNNILASADARMHSKPQLLIYNDDVKCSHGATTGQLDADALFYMQTRGIPAEEARTMLMQAFMVDVIDTIPLEALRDRLRHLVDKRFAGTLAACPTCRLCP